MPHGLTSVLLELASRAGAASAGVTDAAPFFDARVTLRRNREAGRSASLRFTYQDPDLSTDPSLSFPWARFLFVAAWDYETGAAVAAPTGPVVARFATADHYRPLRSLLAEIAGHLRSRGFRAEVLIDDNRLVDRAAAVRAGVGWRGRSTMVLTPRHGPWLLLGSVVTDAPLTITPEMRRGCGSCNACIPACPTGALDDQGLDARRCLAAWLQAPGSIPQWIRPHLGRRIYGCDDCLLACPPGSSVLAGEGAQPTLSFAELLGLGDHDLLARFSSWYVPRRRGRYIRRNLLVAAGNSMESEARPAVVAHLSHPSSMIRSHAYWALAAGYGDRERLAAASGEETVPEALDELELAVLMLDRPELHRAVLEADEWARGEAAVTGLAVSLLEGDPMLIGFHREHQDPVVAPPEDVQLVLDSAPHPGGRLVTVYDPERRIGRPGPPVAPRRG